jgi:regulatory protein
VVDDAPDTPAQLKARALRLLARREHTRAELARKLAPRAESAEALDRLIEELIARKQLSDERYAEERVRVLSRKFGAARIEADLRAKRVSEETIERALVEAYGTEIVRARAAWRRRFGQVPANREEFGKQARFLQSRGFSPSTIRRVLGRDLCE